MPKYGIVLRNIDEINDEFSQGRHGMDFPDLLGTIDLDDKNLNKGDEVEVTITISGSSSTRKFQVLKIEKIGAYAYPLAQICAVE